MTTQETVRTLFLKPAISTTVVDENWQMVSTTILIMYVPVHAGKRMHGTELLYKAFFR